MPPVKIGRLRAKVVEPPLKAHSIAIEPMLVGIDAEWLSKGDSLTITFEGSWQTEAGRAIKRLRVVGVMVDGIEL